MIKRLPAVAALATLLMSSSAVAGPSLDRARKALDDLRYEDAATALDAALKEGSNAPAVTAEIYRLLGEVAAALGDRASAVAYFDRLLALAPSSTLREGVSPKLAEPFEEARARAEARQPLGLRCEISDDAVEVTVSSDPLHMAVVAYQAGNGGLDTAELDGDSAVIVVTDTLLVEEVGLIDEHGNRLVSLPAGECARELRAPRSSAGPARREGKASGSIISHWALWGGVAVGLAAGGTYFGLDARAKVDDLEQMVRDSSAHEYSEARALEDDARRSALLANIGFAAAGVTAIVSGVLLYRNRARTPERDGLSVVPTVGRDGAGVGVSVRF